MSHKKLRSKVVALFNGSPRRRKRVLILLGVAFSLAALLQAVAPEWATVLFDILSFMVSVV